MRLSVKSECAIVALVEEAARDFDLDPGEFLFSEGDDIFTRLEAHYFGVLEQIREDLDARYEGRGGGVEDSPGLEPDREPVDAGHRETSPSPRSAPVPATAESSAALSPT
jgi:hypothetical protein